MNPVLRKSDPFTGVAMLKTIVDPGWQPGVI